jgi:glycosyltransferase involved in cell wall biosynthesis
VRKPRTAVKRQRVLVVLNGTIAGYSGGDLHSAMVANEWTRNFDVEVLLAPGSSREVVGLLRNALGTRVPKRVSSRTPSRPTYLLLLAGRTLRAIQYVLRNNHWDVFVASSHYPFDVLPILCARRGAVRVTFWWHHATARKGRPAWAHWLIRSWEQVLLRLARRLSLVVLTGNTETRQWLVSHGVAQSNVTLTRNGSSLLAASSIGPPPRLQGLIRDVGTEKFALFCARLSTLKGAADLPSIATYVLRSSPGSLIVIAGSGGDEAQSIRQFAGSDDRIKFLGYVAEDEKRWLFDNAQVLMAPSYEEGWGGAVADGVASGCWVIAYDLPALRESSPSGPILIPVGDKDRFAQAVKQCLSRQRPAPVEARHEWALIASSDMDAIQRGRPAASTTN